MSEMKWDRTEYRRIVRAFCNGSELIVGFADGTDIAIPAASLVPPGTQRISWIDIDVGPFDIRVKAEPNTIEIPWSRLRSLTDPEFKAHIDTIERSASQKVGLIIRSLREARELLSTEVAERAGISAQSLSRIELGKHDVVFSTLRRILAAMGCTLRDLALAQSSSAEAFPDTAPRPANRPNTTGNPPAEGDRRQDSDRRLLKTGSPRGPKRGAGRALMGKGIAVGVQSFRDALQDALAHGAITATSGPLPTVWTVEPAKSPVLPWKEAEQTPPQYRTPNFNTPNRANAA